MKKFDHSQLIDSVTLKRELIEGRRLYSVEGGHYPSVTTVLSNRKEKKAAIHKWRARVGKDEADRTTKRATTRGTNYHGITERYIKNVLNLEDHKDSPLPVQMFLTSKTSLDRIDRPRLIESMLWSDKLKIAGQVDLIAEFDGVLSVIDFKTSKSPKKQYIVEDYFTQMCAYGYMFYERYKLEVEQFVAIVACEDGECQVVKTSLKEPHYKKLLSAIKEYNATTK
tara:strand:+ start:7729 stop:8403 length:675 start_codon:yes stop_codon:yes gene_type:complete